MSALTTRIATDLRSRGENEGLVEVVTNSGAFTSALWEKLPKSYAAGHACDLGKTIIASLNQLTASEIRLLLARVGEIQMIIGEGNLLDRCSPSADRLFAEKSCMKADDFSAVLKLDPEALNSVLVLYEAYDETSGSLKCRAGDFFDWYCALASISDYKLVDVKSVALDLGAMLRLVVDLVGVGRLSKHEVAALARNVAELHSRRGLRALRIELLRALRTGDDVLMREMVRERWPGTGRRRTLAKVRREGPAPEQKEH